MTRIRICLCLVLALLGPAGALAGSAVKFTPLHTFTGGDGRSPADMVMVGGMLYGTTFWGGSANQGTLYRVDPVTGDETVLHDFLGTQALDGTNPTGSLAAVGTVIYGTTEVGGANGWGSIFSYDTATGIETVLYSFAYSVKRGGDGAMPRGVTWARGLLYGATQNGGDADSGTVFSFDPATGQELVLHSFPSASATDGANPNPSVIQQDGLLYGTTQNGGQDDGGVLFVLDTHTGKETVLYSFPYGSSPNGSLIFQAGVLYGTTYAGGNITWNCNMVGCGSVFQVDASTGAERDLYLFPKLNGKQGAAPRTGLVYRNGVLYGTTRNGGTQDVGTVFALDVATQAMLGNFPLDGGESGAGPSGLMGVGSTLFVTTDGLLQPTGNVIFRLDR
jgi:uncharacterized repeat protein (TIGR03803 family)